MDAGESAHVAGIRPMFAVTTRRDFLQIIGAGAALAGRKQVSGGWVVCYSDRIAAAQLEGYGTIILDSRYHPPLNSIARERTRVLGYLSLGEVEPTYADFAELERNGLLVGENKSWAGNQMADVRNPGWTKRIVNELIPAIRRAGFEGIFADTLDNPTHLERIDPVRYSGMKAAAVGLIASIRSAHPDIVIAVNRAYDILPDIAEFIDIAVGESVYATYDAGTRLYSLVPEESYRFQRQALQNVKRKTPRVSVFTLDYWDPADAEGIARIYREERANGFEPYVSTRALDRIIPAPAGSRDRLGQSPEK
jgi:polysaccharide biosynthesis protein PelA